MKNQSYFKDYAKDSARIVLENLTDLHIKYKAQCGIKNIYFIKNNRKCFQAYK